MSFLPPPPGKSQQQVEDYYDRHARFWRERAEAASDPHVQRHALETATEYEEALQSVRRLPR